MNKFLALVMVLIMLGTVQTVLGATRRVTVTNYPYYTNSYNYNNYYPRANNYYNAYPNQYYYNRIPAGYRYGYPNQYYSPSGPAYVTKYNSAGGVIGTYTMDGRKVVNPGTSTGARVIMSH